MACGGRPAVFRASVGARRIPTTVKKIRGKLNVPRELLWLTPSGHYRVAWQAGAGPVCYPGCPSFTKAAHSPAATMNPKAPLRIGQTLVGPLFNEPMRVESVGAAGNSSWVVGLVGTQSERFRRVTMTESDLAAVRVLEADLSFSGDGALLRLGVHAYSLGIAYEFDPYFGLSISRVDPLPHQLEAVYDYLLKLARVRFLLADDAGAGKTIMAGLLIRELKLRSLCERILIVAPANLAFSSH
jgi:hypothetical protein